MSLNKSLSLELFLKHLEFLASDTSGTSKKSRVSVVSPVPEAEESEEKKINSNPVWVSDEFWMKLVRMEQFVSFSMEKNIDSRKSDYFQIITDFDHTLTHPSGGQCHDIIANGTEEHVKKELDKCFADSWAARKKGKQTADEFGSFWTEYNNILAHNHFSEDNLYDIFQQTPIHFRDKCDDLFDFSEYMNIPLLVASAGIENLIELVLNQNDYLRSNVAVFANRLIFDDQHNAELLFTPESRLLMDVEDSSTPAAVVTTDECGAVLIPAAVESKKLSPKKKKLRQYKDKMNSGCGFVSGMSAKGVDSNHSLSLQRVNIDQSFEPVSPVIITDYWNKADDDHDTSESSSDPDESHHSSESTGSNQNSSKIIGFGPLIHSRSKHELYELCKEHFDLIRDRPLAICMGDSLGDAVVTANIHHIRDTLKIGFINFDYEKDPMRLKDYQSAFDLLIIEPNASLQIPLQIMRFLTGGEKGVSHCPHLRSDVFFDAASRHGSLSDDDSSSGIGNDFDYIFSVD